MKKLISLFLLICLVLPFLGTYAYLQYQKKVIKHSMKQKMILGLDKKDLVYLKFHKEDAAKQLRWEHEKEFEFDKNMYDVVYTETQADSVTYICWLDSEENLLNQQLGSLVKRMMEDSPNNKNRKAQAFNFYKNLFCDYFSITVATILTEHSVKYHTYFFAYSNTVFYISSPPPEAFFTA